MISKRKEVNHQTGNATSGFPGRPEPNPGGADLHMHSTASDGSTTPSGLIEIGAEIGLAAMALTDHDTVGGVAEFLDAAARTGIEAVPGIEIGVVGKGTLHILGYYIDHENSVLLEKLEEISTGRENRTPRMIANLNACGIPITEEMVLEKADGPGSVGRLHFAMTIVELGFASSVGEAFEKYLNPGMPGYASRPKMDAEEAVKLIRKAGGLAVLAHPKFVEMYMSTGNEFENFVKKLISYGIAGMEVHYTNHTREEEKRYLNLARKLGLIVTGGSDYHGPDKPEYRIGRGVDYSTLPYSVFSELKEKYIQLKAANLV